MTDTREEVLPLLAAACEALQLTNLADPLEPNLQILAERIVAVSAHRCREQTPQR